MIKYIHLGTNDLKRSATFYDALLAVLGAKRFYESDITIVWSIDTRQPSFSVIKPFDGKPATVGNGTMIALDAKDENQVRQLHAKALELGGIDEGAPGLRYNGQFYAAYFRDLDGNKLEAVVFK